MASLNLTVEIPEDTLETTKVGFLAEKPNSRVVTDEDSPDFGNPIYTDKEWLEKCIQDFIEVTKTRGLRKIAKEAVVITKTF